MVSSSLKLFIRVMHARRGLPLISIEHEPHLPALQFQRSARSLACWAWIRCKTSSTTMPGSTSMSNWVKSPPLVSPRQTLKTRLAIAYHSFVRTFACRAAPALAAIWRSLIAVTSLRIASLRITSLDVGAHLAGFEILDLGVGDRDQVRGALRLGALL